jgi:hypothetical protein
MPRSSTSRFRIADHGRAGLNWSPAVPINFITSWNREDGAPSVQQLAIRSQHPRHAYFRLHDGRDGRVNAITGGNPNLEADRRNVAEARRQLEAAQ